MAHCKQSLILLAVSLLRLGSSDLANGVGGGDGSVMRRANRMEENEMDYHSRQTICMQYEQIGLLWHVSKPPSAAPKQVLQHAAAALACFRIHSRDGIKLRRCRPDMYGLYTKHAPCVSTLS